LLLSIGSPARLFLSLPFDGFQFGEVTLFRSGAAMRFLFDSLAFCRCPLSQLFNSSAFRLSSLTSYFFSLQAGFLLGEETCPFLCFQPGLFSSLTPSPSLQTALGLRLLNTLVLFCFNLAQGLDLSANSLLFSTPLARLLHDGLPHNLQRHQPLLFFFRLLASLLLQAQSLLFIAATSLCQSLTFFIRPLSQLSFDLQSFLFGPTSRLFFGLQTSVFSNQSLCFFFRLTACFFDHRPLAGHFCSRISQSFFFSVQTLLLYASSVFGGQAELLFSGKTQPLLLGKKSLFLDKLAILLLGSPAQRILVKAAASVIVRSLAHRFCVALSQLCFGATTCFVFSSLGQFPGSLALVLLSLFAHGFSHGFLARELFSGAPQSIRLHAEARLFLGLMPSLPISF
jgi:hypothetical protein